MGENQAGTYVNGKKQVIELLQALTAGERNRLLSHIRLRNPQMANELSQKSFSFASISEFDEHDLTRVSTYSNPKIFGIALKGISLDHQKQILSKIPREFAEVAYNALLAPQGNDSRSIERAQEKVLGIISTLIQRKQISLS